jgi:hypothetical protein
MEDRCHPLEDLVGSQARVLTDDEFQEEYGKPHGEQHDDVWHQEGSCNTCHVTCKLTLQNLYITMTISTFKAVHTNQERLGPNGKHLWYAAAAVEL